MRAQLRSILPALLSLAPLGAQSGDFQAVMEVAKTTWPYKHHLGVVCNYEASKDQIADLAGSAASGSLITVVDTRSASSLNGALQVLNARGADYLVMLPRDPIFFEGGFPATQLVHGLARKGVPSVGTTPLALQQGAVFAIGERTGNQLLVTDRLQGTVSVILPTRVAGSVKVESTQAYRTPNGVEVRISTLP
jgi:hypothetical protein